jgi:hypothetical protein
MSGKNQEQFDPPGSSRVKTVKLHGKMWSIYQNDNSCTPPSRKKFCLKSYQASSGVVTTQISRPSQLTDHSRHRIITTFFKKFEIETYLF